MMLKGYSKVKAIAFEGKVALVYARGTMVSAVPAQNTNITLFYICKLQKMCQN